MDCIYRGRVRDVVSEAGGLSGLRRSERFERDVKNIKEVDRFLKLDNVRTERVEEGSSTGVDEYVTTT